MNGYSFRVTGRVQGVGFRSYVSYWARRLSLGGWVRNCLDGSVEGVVVGDESAVQTFWPRIKLGPPGSEVNSLTIKEIFNGPTEPQFRIID